MDPELLTLVTSVAGAVAATMASDTFRGLLRSIFRRPRETSIIVEVDGRRIELTGATSEEALAALTKLLAKRQEEGEVASEHSTGGIDDSPDARSRGAQAAAGGEANE
ncbi:hypothetical protein [Streptomyces sp. NPDC018347]|uniref:hypothetical protein n=1 Tax=Streptomyces sp. NPDC018347 TaxID=3157193 RepID=UPI0033FC3B36